MNEILKRISFPIGGVLSAADSGAFFRTPLKYVLLLLGLLSLLGGFFVAYKLVTADDVSVRIACSSYEENKKMVAGDDEEGSFTLKWAKKQAQKEIEACEKARKESSKPWLGALGMIVVGAATAQVMAFRASRLGSEASGKFPVTPIVAQILRAFGEAGAVGFAIMGVFGGLQMVISSQGRFLEGPFAALREFGGGAIVVGPIGAFFLLLATHFMAELAVALVAIANHTAPKTEEPPRA